MAAKTTVKKKNPVGAPRTVSFPPKDMIALGEEMVKWVSQNDPLHLSAWYCIHKCFTDKQWDAMQQMPEFLPYYERALKMVGQKYLDKNSNVRDGISNRWQRVYFKDLRREEDETAKFNQELKANETQTYSPEEVERAKRILDQVTRNQEAVSERKIANSKAKDADKS